MMTSKEKEELIEAIKKEIKDEIAIYVGNSVIRWFLKAVGVVTVSVGAYLIHIGYIKI
jgi:hypothetical protein